MPARWTRAVLRRRVLVLACWLALLVAGVVSSTRLSGLLSNSFAVPGTDSERAGQILATDFGERVEGTFTVVFRVRHRPDRALSGQLRERLRRAARAVPTGHAGVLRSSGGVAFADIATTLDLQHAKRWTDDVRRAARAGNGPPAYVTGQPAIQRDLDPIFAADLRRGEAIAVPIAFLILVAVLGLSLAVAIPFVFAACTITATLAAVYVVAHEVSLVTYVTNLVELIGLALAIDYSLLIVSRFRDELTGGGTVDEAVERTMATAGRTVVFSGTAVAVGLALLLFMPVPFIRSMGVAGFLIPLMSVAAALTLQPVLLSLLGKRALRRSRRASDVERGVWARLSRSIMRRPLRYLAGGAALLVVAAVPVAFLHVTAASISGIPASPESVQGFRLLRDGVSAGAVTPTQIVVDPGHAVDRPVRGAIDRLADELFDDPEVQLVASGSRVPYVDASGRHARVIVAGRHEYGDEATQRFVRRLRDRLVPAARFPAGVHVYAGGPPAQGVDFLARSYGAFPWLVLAVLVLTYVVLLRAFRSIVLPLKAVLLNVLSVAAVYGLLVVVFRWGVGSDLLGLYRMPQVDGWIPIFLFAMLFGLSMDYEVFLVSRMREAWDDVPDNGRAVAYGLERTGGIVTAAAAIMIVAFSGFVVGRVAALQEFGAGLALGVLLEATLVRAILVPAFMAVLGRYNWWLPARIARLARVEASPLAPRG